MLAAKSSNNFQVTVLMMAYRYFFSINCRDWSFCSTKIDRTLESVRYLIIASSSIYSSAAFFIKQERNKCWWMRGLDT
jgi:hypothetical protein